MVNSGLNYLRYYGAHKMKKGISLFLFVLGDCPFIPFMFVPSGSKILSMQVYPFCKCNVLEFGISTPSCYTFKISNLLSEFVDHI